MKSLTILALIALSICFELPHLNNENGDYLKDCYQPINDPTYDKPIGLSDCRDRSLTNMGRTAGESAIRNQLLNGYYARCCYVELKVNTLTGTGITPMCLPFNEDEWLDMKRTREYIETKDWQKITFFRKQMEQDPEGLKEFNSVDAQIYVLNVECSAKYLAASALALLLLLF